jgi:predicted SPOUT superfamily RNA methylase MTH1
VQVRPNLKVDDAMKAAVVVLWVKRFAVVYHLEKAVILRQALKHYIVTLIRKMLCYRQTPSDVSEPQMVNN